MDIKITGMDDVMRNLKKLQQTIEEVQGTHEIPASELFSPSFMQRHTKFPSFDAMIAASGFKVENAQDFKDIPDAKWDAFVRSATKFQSWQAMLEKAGEEWMAGKVKL